MRAGEVYASAAQGVDADFLQNGLRGCVRHVLGVYGHAQRLSRRRDRGGQMLAAGAVQQPGDEPAAKLQVGKREFVQVLQGAELL